MQLNLKFVFLWLMLYLVVGVNGQTTEYKAFYLLFDKNETCLNKDKKFQKDDANSTSIIKIRDCHTDTLEEFIVLDSSEVSVVKNSDFKKINFTTIEELNKINIEERKEFYKNKKSKKSFESRLDKQPIYIIINEKGKWVKYKVKWQTIALQSTIND